MKLHYFRPPHGNFGDDLNAWLWRTAARHGTRAPTASFVGVGTILNRLVPQTRLKIVLGRGRLFAAADNLHDGSWSVLGRGPLSARAAGLPARP